MSLDERSSGNVVDQLIGSKLASLLSCTVDTIEAMEDLPKSSIGSNDKVRRSHELYMRKLVIQMRSAHLWHDMLEAAPTSARDRGSTRAASPTSSLRSTFCLMLRLFQKITLDTYTSMIPWKKFWTPWHDIVLDRLRPVQCDIQSQTANSQRPDREQKAKELILLWMFFTAACIEQMFLTAGARDMGNADRIIFCSSQFTRLAKQLGYQRAADVAADFDKYIAFSVSKQGQILKKLMQPLEQHESQGRHDTGGRHGSGGRHSR
jgi:hypothetical protein